VKRAALVTLALAWLAPARAHATSASLLGFGARNTALAQSNVADADASSSATVNPAFAWGPGVRLLVGYGYGLVRLTVNGRDAHVPDVSGTDLGVQIGAALDASGAVSLGGALALHVPDPYQALVFFPQPTEIQFPLYDAGPQHTTADFALAFRYHALSVGGGASVLSGTGGTGANFHLAQDANGDYADSRTGIDLPYGVAPSAGAALNLGKFAVAARLRGAQSIGLTLPSDALIQVPGNPLNGTTVILAEGDTGYDPLTVDLGARFDVTPSVRVFGDLQYARWSAAPSPGASVLLRLHLDVEPAEVMARFVDPRFRDTLSPRLGVEVRALEMPPGALGESENQTGTTSSERRPARLTLRAGWSVSPSPIPQQTGFTSFADATRHDFALGAGYNFGRVWGVKLHADLALALHVLLTRDFDKPDDALPNAHYSAGGRIYDAALSLGAAFE
jgi:hypothetical protein